jgi:hypothetical protein
MGATMAHISKIIENSAFANEQQKRENNGKGKTLTPKLLIWMWERMGHIHGRKWTSEYGESAVVDRKLTDTAITWGVGLKELTEDQIKEGLRKCINRLSTKNNGEVWPPNLPEFKAMCIDKQSGPEYYRQPITDTSKMLSNFDRDRQREVYSRNLKNIKSILK